MYGREYQGRELHFEPSGGLLYSALVMQDKETDSYWSIMTGNAVAGSFQGEPLQGFATFWYMWIETHPETELLN